eukprot:195320_1
MQIQPKQPPLNQLNSQDIDDILNEIDENEQKQNPKQTHHDIQYWNELVNAISNNNISFIKNAISSDDIDVNAQNPQNGMTLLMYAVVIGNLDLVKAICNFGADESVKDNDGDDALIFAIKYGRYKITKLLYYRQLSGSLGSTLKDFSNKIHQKTKEAQVFCQDLRNHNYKFINQDFPYFVSQWIEQRKEIGADILFYAWYITVYNYKNKVSWRKDNNTIVAPNPLESPLFKSMMKTFTEIIQNTSDKNGWDWLKSFFVNSLIWYLPHPDTYDHSNETKENNANDTSMETILKKTLFYELLTRIRTESKKQSDTLLKDKIDKVKTVNSDQWKQLISYNVNTKYSKNARQDTCGCLTPLYNKQDLSEELFPPSTTFSAQKFYDVQIYLPNLLFTANILDSTFQRDMKLITTTIKRECNGSLNVKYRKGPVKTLTRSRTKVENDYIDENYPTAAKILDINRCALQFESIKDMMKYIDIFTTKVRNNAANSIIDVIRCKNGWAVYNAAYPQYSDVKLNVLVQSKDSMIVAEIQFLLSIMSSFKKKAHKLYSVERKFELVYNFGKLSETISQFNDNIDMNEVITNLLETDTDTIKYFRYLWEHIKPDENTLIDDDKLDKNVWKTALVNVMTDKNDKINNYLRDNYHNLYYKTVTTYIEKYVTKYSFFELFKSICPKAKDNAYDQDFNLLQVMRRIFDLMNKQNNPRKELMTLLCYKDKTKYTFFEGLCDRHDHAHGGFDSQNIFPNVFKLILNSSIINDEDKIQIFADVTLFHLIIREKSVRIENAFQTLQYLINIKTNTKYDIKDVFIKLLAEKHDNVKESGLMRICKNRARDMSSKCLQLLLTTKLIDITDKIKMFSDYSYQKTPLVFACQGREANVMAILNYFDKKQIIKWLGLNKKKSILSGITFASLLVLVKYFQNDRATLFKLLSQNNGRGKSIFRKICGPDSGANKVFKFILHESTMNYKDIFKVLFALSDDYGDYPTIPFFKGEKLSYDSGDMLLSGPFLSAHDILLHLKNDKRQMIKLLTHRYNNGIQTFLMNLCGTASTNKWVKFILNDTILTYNDIFKLLNYSNRQNHTALYYAFQQRKKK